MTFAPGEPRAGQPAPDPVGSGNLPLALLLGAALREHARLGA